MRWLTQFYIVVSAGCAGLLVSDVVSVGHDHRDFWLTYIAVWFALMAIVEAIREAT